jgi:hypothetical protein
LPDAGGSLALAPSGAVCVALDFDEQKRSGFRYQYSSYQIEYSRNLVFQVGGHLDQVFQALIDRSRAPLDLQTIKTIERSLYFRLDCGEDSTMLPRIRLA